MFLSSYLMCASKLEILNDHNNFCKTDNEKGKNGLILEQLLLGNFQIADLLLFTWALINTQPRQDLSIGLST